MKETLRVGVLDAPWKRGRDAVGSHRTPKDRRAAPPITIPFVLRSLCASMAILQRCRRPYRAVTVIPLHSYQFVLSMNKVRAVARRSMRPSRVHWRIHCVAAAMLAFPMRPCVTVLYGRVTWYL